MNIIERGIEKRYKSIKDVLMVRTNKQENDRQIRWKIRK